MTVEFFAVSRQVPLYLKVDDASATETTDQTVGAAVSDGRSTLFFIPDMRR